MTETVDIEVGVREFIVGDSSVVGDCTPGTFAPCEDFQDAYVQVEVI